MPYILTPKQTEELRALVNAASDGDDNALDKLKRYVAAVDGGNDPSAWLAELDRARGDIGAALDDLADVQSRVKAMLTFGEQNVGDAEAIAKRFAEGVADALEFERAAVRHNLEALFRVEAVIVLASAAITIKDAGVVEIPPGLSTQDAIEAHGGMRAFAEKLLDLELGLSEREMRLYGNVLADARDTLDLIERVMGDAEREHAVLARIGVLGGRELGKFKAQLEAEKKDLLARAIAGLERAGKAIGKFVLYVGGAWVAWRVVARWR